MIASLPMYDWPEVREATDALWQAIAARLGTGIGLTRVADYTSAWRAPDLVFAQTCGYPFTHEFRGRLAYVATPHYAADGCEGAGYRSIVFARRKAGLENFRGAVAAVNNADSMSGMLALKLVFGPLARQGRFFSEAVATGGHIASMIAVRDGKAEVCAIDAVCVALARRDRPDYLEGLHEIARSPLVPALPFVTQVGSPPRIRAALADVMNDPALAGVRERLLLSGLSVLEPAAYDRILDLEQAMQAAGGLELL